MAVASLLLALGVQSAWRHAANWVSPPPPPLTEQIDILVRTAAISGLALEYQSTATLHPGGGPSYVFVFRPTYQPRAVVWPSSELRIYDLRNGRLRSSYRFQPLADDAYTKSPRTFDISVLSVSDYSANGANGVVASLNMYAADAIPTFPVVIRWRASTDSYFATPVMSTEAPPRLHGSHAWTRGYMEAMTVWNQAKAQERFRSYHAESVEIGPGDNPVLLGVFYAHAKSRAEPIDLEVNLWPLKAEAFGICSIGTKYPQPPLFVKSLGAASYSFLLSKTWNMVRSKTFCY